MLNKELRKLAADAAAKRKPKTDSSSVKAMTVAEWCRETNSERHSLMQKLTTARIEPAGDAKGKAAGAKLYKIGDLYRAMGGGEFETERLRKTREEADKLALANARSRGELIEIASVRRLGEKVMAAVRNRIVSMPLTDEEKDGCLRELLSLSDMDWTREP